MAQLSPADRLRAITGRMGEIKVPAKAAPVEPAPAPVLSVETVTAAPAPVAPAASVEGAIPDASEGSDSEGTKRFRFSSDEDKAIAQIAKARGVSLPEAVRIYAGTAAPVAVPAVESPAAPVEDTAVAAYDTSITQTQDQIKALTLKRDAATDDLDHREANKINDQLADLKAELRIFENEKKGHVTTRDREAQGSQQRQIEAAANRVYENYPAFAVEDSMERLALDAYVSRALNDKSRAAEFKDPNWPEKLAVRFAEAKGIKPKNAAAGPAPAQSFPAAKPSLTKPAPQQVAAVAGARLLTGSDGQGTPSGSRPMTKADALNLIRTNPEARRAIVKQLGTLR